MARISKGCLWAFIGVQPHCRMRTASLPYANSLTAVCDQSMVFAKADVAE